MVSDAKSPGYKDITFQQLRSFCETARLGSMKAAADFLELAHPTVWQQVHALERVLKTKLVEPHGRGCRLTDDGRLLDEMAGHLVVGINSLPQSFQEARSKVRPRLTIVTTQRALVEDLPDVVVALDTSHPELQLCFLEVHTKDVIPTIESGAADLGLTIHGKTESSKSRLVFERGYELELFLVTPRDHPLSRRRRITPADLRKYPWVNTPHSQSDTALNDVLETLGVFESEPRRIEAHNTATIRRYVELGFGIGLVVGLPSHDAPSQLHQRSLSRQFGRVPVNLVWRKGSMLTPHARALIDAIKKQLDRKTS